MSDNMGVLGSTTATVIGTNTVYTCPANKAAKFKIMGIMQFGASSDVGILVNAQEVARTGAMTAANYNWTAKGAGLFGGVASATKPDGTTAAKTIAPCDVIYYLSAGQTVQQTVATANLTANNIQVVGIEIDLTLL